MTKAPKVIRLICLTLALAASPVHAQSDAVSAATREAVLRQADVIELKKALVDAAAAHQRGDLVAADKYYEKCYRLAQSIGSGDPVDTKAAINGLTGVLVELARKSQAGQDYRKAGVWLDRANVVDPTNQAIVAARAENIDMLQRQAGTIPSQEVIESLPAMRTNSIRVTTLVRDAKVLYEMDKLDDAEAKLTEALKEQPGNLAALHYMEAIKQRKMAEASRRGEVIAEQSMVEVQEAWTDRRPPSNFIQRPNNYARSELPHTGSAAGRQRILNKLDRIRIDSVKFEGLPLSEVINNISELTKARDPEKTGINFLTDRQAPAPAPTAVGGVDPATGLPVAPAALPTEGTDVSAVTVKISPALTDIRLADLLDAITKTADKPIKYSILDYGVIFSLQANEPTPLETRSFRVDPNTFQQGLQNVLGIPFGSSSSSSGSGGGSSGGGGGGGSSGGGSGSSSTTYLPQVTVITGTSGNGSSGGGGGGGGGGGAGGGGGGGGGQSGGGLRYVTSATNQTVNIQLLAKQFFQAIGIDFGVQVNATGGAGGGIGGGQGGLGTPSSNGKALAFNDRKGILFVRATSQDLDTIEAALQALNQAPPEINIKTKFVEVSQDDDKALGFTWYMGNTQLGAGVGLAGGTQPTLQGNTTSPNFPGTSAANIIPSSATDNNVTTGLRNTYGQKASSAIPTLATITGILSQPQFRLAIQALEQRSGFEVLNEPEVTTESGRQAQFQAVDIETIVTGLNVNNSSSSAPSTGSGTTVSSASTAANYSTDSFPLGPTLDVIPYVSADGFTIQMTIIPTFTEFLGYDSQPQFNSQSVIGGATANGQLSATQPLPKYRLRQVTTSAIVYDAQTIVLGGLISDSVTKVKDKVPFLGDLPLVGRLFQSSSSSKSKKNLMIFVTPTIINPDGTRYHSDEEMPFNQNSATVSGQ